MQEKEKEIEYLHQHLSNYHKNNEIEFDRNGKQDSDSHLNSMPV